MKKRFLIHNMHFNLLNLIYVSWLCVLEVLNNYQRKKLDESNDEEFYSDPKFVYHLDANFRQYLSNVYKKEISDNSTVLDLMSSWDSYLPQEKKYKKVIGHGLNKQELEKNKLFDSYCCLLYTSPSPRD